MRKIVERILCVMLCIALMMGFTVTGSAATAQYKVSAVYGMGAVGNFTFQYKTADGKTHTHTDNKVNLKLVGTDQIVSTTIAGQMIKQQGHNLKVGYCLDPNLEAVNGSYDVDMSEEQWANLKDTQREYIYLAIAYGFPNIWYDDYEYTSNDAAYVIGSRRFAATQTIIWEILNGYRNCDSGFTINSGVPNNMYATMSASDGGTYAGTYTANYNGIVDAIRRHSMIPSFADRRPNIISYEMDYDSSSKTYMITLTDTNGIVSATDYGTWECNVDGVTVTRDGSSITVTATQEAAESIGDGAVTFSSIGHVYDGSGAGCVVLKPAGFEAQPMIVNNQPDPVPVYFNLSIPTATINVTKTTGDGSSPAGFTFEAKDGDTVAATATTDADGNAVLEGLEAGKTYTVHEALSEEQSFFWNQPADQTVNAADPVSYSVSVENTPRVYIRATTSRTNYRTKMLQNADRASIYDDVELTNLEVGREYQLTSTIVTADGTSTGMTATTTFTATAETQIIAVNIENTSSRFRNLSGTYYIWEDLATIIGDTNILTTIASEHDLTGTAQIIYAPSLHTTLTDAEGNKVVDGSGKVTLVDVVAYSGVDTTFAGLDNVFQDGSTPCYTMVGNLFCADCWDYLNLNASATFVPAASSGTVNVTFADVDLSGHIGHHIVCFESLRVGPNPVCDHSDPEDANQTVEVAGLSTTAASDTGSHYVAIGTDETITDTVSITAPAGTYMLSGKIVDATTGDDLIVNGSTVEAEQEITWAGGTGTATMDFTIDTSDLAGSHLVVYEYLTEPALDAPHIVAKHTDKDSTEQAIFVPYMRTTAAGTDGSKTISLTGNVTIVDRVYYEGLIPGEQITLTTSLYNAETGEAAKDKDGNAVTKTQTFTPAASAGYTDVTITFDIDVSTYEGSKYVVFESMYENGKATPFIVHNDLTDTNQTISFPSMSTTAHFDDDAKEHEAVDDLSLYDDVTYSNLDTGTEYTLTASLVSTEDGSAVVDADGKPVTATKTFTPETADGTVTVTFEHVDLTDYGSKDGTQITVFEVLTKANASGEGDTTVCEHKDLTDTDQTVTVVYSNTIFKYDAADRSGLEGTTFEVTDTVSGKVYTVVTDDEGYAYFPLIYGREFKIQETVAPAGYSLDETVYSLTMNEDGSVTGISEFKNIKIGSVLLRKVDALTGLPVAGAELTVYDEDGNAVYSAYTDDDGYIYFYPFSGSDAASDDDTAEHADSASAVRVFTFKETEAPAGYYISEAVVSFTVSDDGKVGGDTKLVIRDVPVGCVVLRKIDKDGNVLQGAKFAVYDAETNELLYEGTTDEYGEIMFLTPGPGNYYYVETEAPAGYRLVTDKVEFSIDEDGKISGTTSLVNQKVPVNTGDLSLVSAFGTIAVSIAAYFAARKKKDEQ